VEFEWDEARRLTNRMNHGVDLATAVEIDWDDIGETEHHGKDYGERRWVAFGRIGDRVRVLI
jgi:uncharacterized DUF497 family protein